MAIDPTYSVFCDEPSCPQWTAGEMTRNDAWLVAKAEGWTRRRMGSRWFYTCPRHRHPIG